MQNRQKRLQEYRTYIAYPSGATAWRIKYPWFDEVFDVRTDVRNGDHKSPNPCEFTHQTSRHFVGTSSMFYKSSGEKSYDLYGPSGICPPLYEESLTSIHTTTYNMALSNFWSKVRDGVDVSVDLGQTRQIGTMIKAAANVVRHVNRFDPIDLVRAYRAVRFAAHDPKGAMKRLGSLWLEFQYGWRPMAQEIYEIAHRYQNPKPVRLVAKGRGKDVWRSEYKRQIAWDYYENQMTFDALVARNERCEIVASFYLPPNVLQSLGDVTSLNPASIAWELTPYSFVVDWFFDIGGWLRNLETALLYRTSFETGYVTEGLKLTVDAVVNPRTESTDRLWLHAYDKGYNYFNWKRRQVLSNVPLPRPPQFRADLGSSRLLNSAALLSQHLGRHHAT